jgi:hypothetical protein
LLAHTMKKLIAALVVSFSLAAVCLLLPGCSKSKDAGSGSGSSTTPSGPVAMKVKWNTGKEYVMQMEMSEISEFNLPNRRTPIKQKTDTAMDYTITVLKELADGGRELELKFTTVKINSLEGNRRTMNFDSTQNTVPDANDPVGSMFRKVIGKHVRLLMDADGKVTRVEGFNELAARVVGNGQPQAKAMFNQMFSEDSFKQLGMFAESMPNHPMKAGDRWTVNLELPNPIGIIVINSKNTFKEWESHAGRQCIRIEYQGNIYSKPGPTSTNVPVKIEKGKISGNTWFDPVLGMVVETTGDHHMTLQVKNQGRSFTGQVHHISSLRLAEVEDVGK